MRRAGESAISVGAGSQVSYQFVDVLTQLFPEYFERIPALEGFLITILAMAVAIPLSYGFTVYGKNVKRNG